MNRIGMYRLCKQAITRLQLSEDPIAGETIPASDSEDDEGHQESQLEGASRERSMWIMRRIAQELGTGSDVVAVLAKRFKASEGLISCLLFLHRTPLSLMRLTSRHRIREFKIPKVHLDTSPHGWAEVPQALVALPRESLLLVFLSLCSTSQQ